MTQEEEFYAGIGTRTMSQAEKVQLMQDIISLRKALAKYTLRSGGAKGTDTVFEKVHIGKKEIYLPWKGFNNNPSLLYNITHEAEQLARHYHPIGNQLEGSTLKLMARNGYQVLGQDLKTPVKFIACFTASPLIGGTSQALRIAKDYNIPIFNLIDRKTFLSLIEFLNE